MPDTPATTLIADEVESRMGNITTGNGYNYTQKKIQRARLTPWNGIDMPAINIWSSNVINEKNVYDGDEREIQLFIEFHHMTRDESFQTVADKLAVDIVTALNRRANPTSGTSKSDTGMQEDMSAETDVAFKIVVDGDAAETVTCVWTGATSGKLIAAEIQTRIRALGGNKASVTVVFNTGRYVITSATTGTSSAVVITPGDALSCTDELRIGIIDGGIEVSGLTAAPAVADDPSLDLEDTVMGVVLFGYDYIIGQGEEPFCGVIVKFGIKYLTTSMDMINYNRE